MANLIRKTYWNAFTLWHARDEGKLPYRPLEEITKLQEARVRAIVAHAYETVPHYREVMKRAGLRPRDFRTAEDLAQLPILTGDEVARAPELFLSERYDADRTFKLESSGTSGRSKTIYYDPAALFRALAYGNRQRAILARFVGRTYGYRELSASGRQSKSVQLRSFYEAHSFVPRGIDYKRDHLSPEETFAENVEQVNAFRPQVILGYGSYIGTIFRWAFEHGVRIFRPKAVVYGADRMPEQDRHIIETEFGVPVLSTYQSVEALRIAFQCEQRKVFHLNIDQLAVRVVDEGGCTLDSGGTGEIIISNLVNRATVLLNYKISDRVTVGRAGCPCGRTLPTIERIEGRSNDLILLPGGRLMHPLAVLHDLQGVPGVVQVQLIQEDVQNFRLRAVAHGGLNRDEARRSLEAAFRGRMTGDISLAVEWVDAIKPEPGGKVREVISYCRS